MSNIPRNDNPELFYDPGGIYLYRSVRQYSQW